MIFFKAKQECIKQVKQEYVNNFTHCVFENNVDFTGMEFSNAVNFTGSQFQGDAKFTSIKFGDNSKKNESKYNVSFLDTSFFKNVNFQHAQFHFSINFRNAKFYQAVFFDEAPFYDDVDFTYTNFEKSSSFRKTKFEKEAIFHDTLFNKSYFIDTIFSKEKEIDFKSCIFEDMFYFEAKNIKPIFFDCNFGNQASIKLEYLKYDYEELKEKIKNLAEEQVSYCKLAKEIKKETNILDKKELREEISKYFNSESSKVVETLDKYFKLDKLKDFLENNEKEYYRLPKDKLKQVSIALRKELEKLIEQDDKSKKPKSSIKQDNEFKEHIAQKYRSLFRKLKSNNLTYHNLIDASKLHTQELYAREIELEEKKSKVFSKEWIDKWQLFFYRKLCDHHTDLLLNLKWLIYAIALYILLLGKIPILYPMYLIYPIVLIIYMCYKETRSILLILSFIIIFITICNNPKLIFGVSNLFLDNLNWWQNLITAVYMIVLGLVLFSLQKTARKNSIIPT
ncbi:pentapeptide repeat-containing protein [Campylobacter sp.]|uniref:pentapeptide repeat-containing protein n=1 Tax=Campylobacter sp. TaxID=205 RepID=UPI0025C67E6D|nr:pentapeptide repeat-containing protein [Campylobacter sp.]